MKQFSIGVLIIAFGSGLLAQNNSITFFSNKTDSIINGTNYIIVGDAAVKDVKEDFGCVMSIQDSMLVAVKRIEISTIPNTFDYYCWYLCYGPVASGSLPIWKADDSLWLYKNDTIYSFTSYLQPEMNLGQAEYQYVFYPADNPSDSVHFNITFDIATVGVEKYSKSNIKLYPNPANDFIQVEVPAELNPSDLSIEIYSVSGKLIFSERLNNRNNSISTSAITVSGSYLVRIKNRNQIVYHETIQIFR